MFDTHCHLNFNAFDNKISQVIEDAKAVGIRYFVIPGTDIVSSKKAIKIAQKYKGVFAAVGIHPHHLFSVQTPKSVIGSNILKIEELLVNEKAVAVGEVGIDRHYYEKTKYIKYQINDRFLSIQREMLEKFIDLALYHKKSLILHNREAKDDIIKVLKNKWKPQLENKTVFHCCDPDTDLLEFAIAKKIFIGVDGDVTYNRKKQEFVKKIPLELLVLETDSPFLKPLGLFYPNEPKNLKIIAEFIAKLTNVSVDKLIETTTKNAKFLFGTSDLFTRKGALK